MEVDTGVLCVSLLCCTTVVRTCCEWRCWGPTCPCGVSHWSLCGPALLWLAHMPVCLYQSRSSLQLEELCMRRSSVWVQCVRVTVFFRVLCAIKDAMLRDVLEKVDCVCVKDGSFRLCGDGGAGGRPAPSSQTSFCSLAGGQSFTKCCAGLPAIAVRRCVVCACHLVWPLLQLSSSAPWMPCCGLPRVMCYLDDIIMGEKEHLATLATVLERLRSHGFRLCFLQPCSLGHVVDAQGLHTTEGKRQAVADAPAPTNVPELCVCELCVSNLCVVCVCGSGQRVFKSM